ncbi:hypothetical protein KUV89_01055 [Marinobacter hydrocarbonoclasticus]|nr:hypothetical protein [Marinobacter nauticus]
MKKFFIPVIALAVALVAIGVFNSVKPLNDVLGCYKSSVDKICILDGGIYQQLLVDGKQSSSGNWRSFKYNAPEGEYTALVFYGYLTKSNARIKEVEAQPESTLLEEGYFYLPESTSTDSPLMRYTK